MRRVGVAHARRQNLPDAAFLDGGLAPVQQRTVVQHVSAIKWPAAGKAPTSLNSSPRSCGARMMTVIPNRHRCPEPTPKAAEPSPVLTENGLVLSVDEKAPRSQPSS